MCPFLLFVRLSLKGRVRWGTRAIRGRFSRQWPYPQPVRMDARGRGVLARSLYVYDYAGVADAARCCREVKSTLCRDRWTHRLVDCCPRMPHRIHRKPADTMVGDLMVAILPTPDVSGVSSRGMGHAPVEGSVVYAFLGRIRAFAFDRNLLPATLPGHVVAHEAGPPARRACASGLMRSRWVSRTAAPRTVVRFTATQGRRIRSRVGVGVVRDPPNWRRRCTMQRSNRGHCSGEFQLGLPSQPVRGHVS
jgi:hypothetical protein